MSEDICFPGHEIIRDTLATLEDKDFIEMASLLLKINLVQDL